MVNIIRFTAASASLCLSLNPESYADKCDTPFAQQTRKLSCASNRYLDLALGTVEIISVDQFASPEKRCATKNMGLKKWFLFKFHEILFKLREIQQ